MEPIDFFHSTANTKFMDRSLVTSLLENKQKLKCFFHEREFYQSHDYLANIVIDYLIKFNQHCKQVIHEYLYSNKADQSLVEPFLNLYFNHHYKELNRKQTLNSFAYHDSISDQRVKNLLNQYNITDNPNVLGFGCGDGYYERSLCQYLSRANLIENYTLFGYEPNARTSSEIKFLTPKLLQENVYTYDIVVARWVLHHIQPQHRWTDFIRCLDNCRTGGTVVIIEHGFDQGTEDILTSRWKKLITLIIDVIANLGIRPTLFTSTSPIGKNFHIEYLNHTDITSILESTKSTFNLKKYQIGPPFLEQTLIVLNKKH